MARRKRSTGTDGSPRSSLCWRWLRAPKGARPHTRPILIRTGTTGAVTSVGESAPERAPALLDTRPLRRGWREGELQTLPVIRLRRKDQQASTHVSLTSSACDRSICPSDPADNQRIFDWNDALVAERHLIERGGSFGQNPARISVGPIHPRCRWSPLLAKEFSRERRRSVKDPRPIFDRDFEFTSFVPLVP